MSTAAPCRAYVLDTRVCPLRSGTGTAHRGTKLLHHRIGEVHPAPAGCDWLPLSVQSSSGRGASPFGNSAAAAAVAAFAAEFPAAESPNTATRLKASGGEVRPTSLMSQRHPASSRITSHLHLVLPGSRRTALNLLAARWSSPMCSSLPRPTQHRRNVGLAFRASSW